MSHDDHMASSPDELPRGARIGKYEVIRIIGSGGMGAVYEALHPELKKRVAIKTLHRAVALHPQARQRFLREGEAASRIRHPHVVDVTDVGMHEGQPFLVMELLDGVDLSGYLAERGRLAVSEAVDLMLPVIAAVGAGHDEGVIHRDLKPNNVFLSWNRQRELHPKVLDFGVSKLLDGTSAGISLTGTEAVMGTIAYMSPEQAKGAKYVDARTDQYALGLLLYECVTGQRGHEGENALAVLRLIGDGHIEPPSSIVPGLPPGFEDALMQALLLDPDARYASVYDFGKALLPFAGERSRSLWRATFERLRASTGARPVVNHAAALSAAAAAAATAAAGKSGPAAGRSARAETPVERGRAQTPMPSAVGTTPRSSGGGTPVSASTLGRSAAELYTTSPPRRGKVSTFVIGVTAVAVIAGGVALLRRQGGPRDEAAPPEPVKHEVVPQAGAAPPRGEPAAAEPAVAPPPAATAEPRKYRVAVTVRPPEAEVTLDDAPAGKGGIDRELVADGKPHVLRVTAPGYETHVLTFLDAPPPPTISLSRLRRSRPAAAAAPGVEPSPAATPAAAPAPRVGANQAPIIKE